jgi:hypothetical protein
LIIYFITDNEKLLGGGGFGRRRSEASVASETSETKPLPKTTDR